MGSSFMDFRDVGFWTNDGVLEVWLHFLVQEIDSLPVVPAWLAEAREAREAWYVQATNSFVGCHWLDLDSYITTAARRATLLRLIESAIERMRSFGERIPAEELNAAGIGGPGEWATPGPLTRLITCISEAFLLLLAQVPLNPERPPGFVATVLEHRDDMFGKGQRVTLQLRSGQANAGEGRLLLPTGQAYAVGITDVWLFNGRMPGFLSPDDADKVIVTLTGVASDLLESGVVLAQQGKRLHNPEDKAMSSMKETEPQTITVRTGQMVFAIPSDEDGVDEVVSVTDDNDTDATEPINLGGAWAGLVDADTMLDALERMGHEAPPTPPILSIDLLP